MSQRGKPDPHGAEEPDEDELPEASISALPLTALSEFGHF